MKIKIGKRKMGPGFGDFRLVCGPDLTPDDFFHDGRIICESNNKPKGHVFFNDRRTNHTGWRGGVFLAEWARPNNLALRGVEALIGGGRKITHAEVFRCDGDDGDLLVISCGFIFDIWCCVKCDEIIEEVEA